MANIVLTNFGDATLNAGIAAGDLSMTVAAGTGALFPAITGGNWFYLVLEDVSANREIVKVTARASDTMTIVRAQEGTTARAFSSGSLVSLRMTLQTFIDYVASVALTAAGAATLQNKTLDNSTALTIKDVNLTLQDDGDVTKQLKLQLSGLTTATTRTLTVQDKDLTLAGINVAQTLTGAQRGAVTVSNTLAFDLSLGNNFAGTPTGAATLTFSNLVAGQSGSILLANGSNYAISKAATTKSDSSFLAAVSATGTYRLSYYCDGTNVYVTTSGAMA